MGKEDCLRYKFTVINRLWLIGCLNYKRPKKKKNEKLMIEKDRKNIQIVFLNTLYICGL